MIERFKWWLFDIALKYVCNRSPDTYGALYLWLKSQDKSLSAIINKTFNPDKLQFAWAPDEEKRGKRRQQLAEMHNGGNPLFEAMKKWGEIKKIDGGRTIAEDIKFYKDGHE